MMKRWGPDAGWGGWFMTVIRTFFLHVVYDESGAIISTLISICQNEPQKKPVGSLLIIPECGYLQRRWNFLELFIQPYARKGTESTQFKEVWIEFVIENPEWNSGGVRQIIS